MESFYRIFSDQLPADKCWYALNCLICGCRPKRFIQRLPVFHNHFKEISIEELSDVHGSLASPKAFLTIGTKRLCGGYAKENVVVASGLGVLLATLKGNTTSLEAEELEKGLAI